MTYDTLPILISGCSLAVSALVAYLTLFRKGAVEMTQPTMDKDKWGQTPLLFNLNNMSSLTPFYFTVHGFMDDLATCQEVVTAMNFNACKETGGQGCLNPYSCTPLNH